MVRIIVLALLAALIMSTAALAADKVTDINLGDGKDWAFTSGPWTQKDGVINPPDQRNLHSRAFYTPTGFGDMTVEFDVNGNYRENGQGDAGLILRAQDTNHYYFVHFPWGGQQLRAGHFWAAVAKVNGDGYTRNMGMVWVPGVPSETERWFHVKVVAKGPKIDVWVDGHFALSVTDKSYKRGCVGMAGYGWYSFRNIKVTGGTVRPPKWDRNLKVPTHTFTVGLDSTMMPTACVAPNGDILIAGGDKLVRSKDKGRTWGAVEALPAKLGGLNDYGNTMYRTKKGRLIAMIYRSQAVTEKAMPEIAMSESTDNGVTWTDPVPSEVAGPWPTLPKSLTPYGPILETDDGTMIRFMLGGATEDTVYAHVVSWGAIHCKAYSIRSTDGGKSWSAPVDLDRPHWAGVPDGTIPGSLDLTEPTGVADGNKIMVVVRPVYSPGMWQCWSYNAGESWDRAARTTFPGYAQSMIKTQNGTVLVGHRTPCYSINASRDFGLNWDAGTIIDYPTWAMGTMTEVEPNVVLCTYMGWTSDRHDPLNAQLIRVTDKDIFPIVVNK